MQKNTSNQKWLVFAFVRASGLPKTSDADNITASIRKNSGDLTALTDTNPVEIGNGYYEFELTQAETNAYTIDLLPASATSGVEVIGVPTRLFTSANADFGTYALSLTIKDNNEVLTSAICSIYEDGDYTGVWKQINGTGTIYLMPGDYTLLVNAGPGYETKEVDITISANDTLDIEVDNKVVLPPSSPGLCTVYGYISDITGTVLEDVVINFDIIKQNSLVSTSLIANLRKTVTSDAQGYFEVDLIQGGQFISGDGKYKATFTNSSGTKVFADHVITIGDVSTVNILSLMG